MKSKVSAKRCTSKLAAKALGVCMTAGLAVMGATSVQATIYNPYNGSIPYTYLDDAGRGPTKVTVPAFRVQGFVQDRGWIDGFGTTGENRRLQVLRFTQLLDAPKLCLRVFITKIGWTTEQCTNGVNSMITVGPTQPYQPLPIESVAVSLKDCTYNNNLTARAHLADMGWQEPTVGLSCNQELILGTQRGGIRLEALELRITDACPACVAP